MLKISIITVVRNNQNTIGEAIDSVLNQTYSNIEYIVIDGKSTDGTIAVIESYGSKISKFLSEKDNGLYDAMNKGLMLATGDVIGFINADDMLNDKYCIEQIVNTFESTTTDVVYGDKIYINPLDSKKVVRFWKAGPFDLKNYKKGWMTPHLSTYIKKSLYDKHGGFRDDFKIAADYELMLRFIYKNKAKVKYLPITIAKMRAGGLSNGSLKNIAISNFEVYKSWKVNGMNISPFIIIAKPLRKLVQLFKKYSK